MEDYCKAILELSKMATTERVVSSRLVTSKPCWILASMVEPDNANTKSQVKLINGEISSQTVLVNIKPQGGYPVSGWSYPLYFNKGLYIELTDNADAITIQYLIDSS